MSQARHLRLVPDSFVETFAFADGPGGMIALHNGKPVRPCDALKKLADIASILAERADARLAAVLPDRLQELMPHIRGEG